MTTQHQYNSQLPLINSLISGCEERIRDLTNIDLKLLHDPVIDLPKTQDDFIKALINDCCKCWGTESTYIMQKKRVSPVVEMRQLATYLIFKCYPKITLKRLGHYFDQDHTTIIASLTRVRNRISVGDDMTMKLFTKIKHLLPDEKVQD